MIGKKSYQISLFVIICILLNYYGKIFAVHYHLPLWLDSFGTILTAYVLGPICGAVVGLAGNLIYGLENPISSIYGLTSIAIGITAGVAARKKWLDHLFGTMTMSVLVTLVSIVISVPLNILFYKGNTGNLWGDGVIAYLKEQGMPRAACVVFGEFYIDFLDKVATLLALYLLIKIVRAWKKRNSAHKAGLFAVFLLTFAISSSLTVSAAGQQMTDTLKEQPEAGTEKQAAAESEGQPETGTEKQAAAESEGQPETGTEKQAAAESEEKPQAETDKEAQSGQETGQQPDYADGYLDYVQTIYNKYNGLPCGESNDIVQTSDGILWVGTYAGLYRYNGSEFRWMEEYESVKNVNCLYVDEEGRLWIGTNDNGLSICINEQVVNVLDEDSGLISNSVRCIAKCTDGYYYVGTSGSMQVVELNGGLKIAGEIPSIHYAHSIAVNDSGYTATVTAGGELFLLRDMEIRMSNKLSSPNEIYLCCAFDENGMLYAGTSGNHVYLYDISDDEWNEKGVLDCGSLENINHIQFAEDGKMFICADNGVGYIENGSFHSINTNEFNSSVDHMAIDYQGNLWFTSHRLGLLRLAKSAFTDIYNVIGMEHKVVNTSCQWQDKLYIGTDTGLDLVDAACKYQIFDDLTNMLSGVRIRCIRKDSRDHLWICTYGEGTFELDKNGEITTYDSTNPEFGNRARVVVELHDGTIAVSDEKGIHCIKDRNIVWSIPHGDALGNAMILTILEKEDGTILAGTDGEGIAVIQDGEVVQKLTREDGLSSGVVMRMIKDEDGNGIFIITSNGLCYMNGSNSVYLLKNFPYSNNYDLQPVADGKLFVLSSAGIYVVNRDDLLSDATALNYEVLDVKRGLNGALTANSWNYVDEEGNLYLSCDTGIYKINMKNYGSVNHSYRMMISSVRLDNTSYLVERGTPITMGRGISKMEIFPEVINYTIEDPYVSYFLEGFDAEPTILPQSKLTRIEYTNLPTGSYTFHLSVLGTDKEEVWEHSAYSVIKEKEIYDNQWFKIYMLLVAMLAVAWFTWFFVRTQIQRTLNFQKKELEFARRQLEMGNETILAIAKTVDAKDENTSQHSQRVSEYSVLIAKELGFDDETLENLRKAALLHDLGKIGIPDRILNKPSRLTDDEYEIMKSHVTRGAQILKDFTLVDHVVDGALYHHERYDGKGYVHGLAGGDIPLYARIIGVADAFDAMTANRVYRKKLDFDYVLGELERGRGAQFDPVMVDILLRLIKQGRIDVNALYENSQERAGTGSKEDSQEGTGTSSKEDSQEGTGTSRKEDREERAGTSSKEDREERAETSRKEDREERAGTSRKEDCEERAGTSRKEDCEERAGTSRKEDREECAGTSSKEDSQEGTGTSRKEDREEGAGTSSKESRKKGSKVSRKGSKVSRNDGSKTGGRA